MFETNTDFLDGDAAMRKKDEFDDFDMDSEEEFFDEPEYSSKNEHGTFTQNLLSKVTISTLLIGAGVVGLLILNVALLAPRGNSEIETKIRSLQTRIKQLEDRVYTLDGIEAKLRQLEDKSNEYAVFLKSLREVMVSSTQGAVKPSVKETEVRYHEVRPGETLWTISRSYGLTLDELRRLNKLAIGAVIQPGQKLAVSPADNSGQ